MTTATPIGDATSTGHKAAAPLHMRVLLPDQEDQLRRYANNETTWLGGSSSFDPYSVSGAADIEDVYINLLDELASMRMVRRALSMCGLDHSRVLVAAHLKNRTTSVYLEKRLGRMSSLAVHIAEDPAGLVQSCERVELGKGTADDKAKLDMCSAVCRSKYHAACFAYVAALAAVRAEHYEHSKPSAVGVTAPHWCRVSTVHRCPCGRE